MIKNLWFKDSKLLSAVLYSLMIIGLVLGYIFSLEYYKSFNFAINEGIFKRALIMIPLIIALIYTLIFIIPSEIKRLSNFYWYLFLILSIVPLTIVYIMNGITDSKNGFVFIYLVGFIGIFGVYLINRIDFDIPSLRISEKNFWIFIIAFVVVGYSYLIYKLGLPTKILLAFKDVYEVRLNYRNEAGRFVDYFVQWLGNIVNPFILSYLIYKKKYRLVFIPILLEVVLYGYTAYKSLFAALLLAPFFGAVLSYGLKKSFLEVMITLGVFAGLIAGYLGKLSIYLLIVLRIFLWPSLIALEYYDFFWMYPKIYLSHSILGHFFRNVYNMDPTFYMARVYYGKPDMRLNVTWYGDAYMNFGIGGIILFALLLYFIMLVIRTVEKKNIYLVSALLFGGIMALFNGPILTTLLTNGLGVGLLLAYLLPEKI